MFERWTERARRVLSLASDEARTMRHNYIGTEHVLLGMLAEGEGVASHALTALDINLGQTRADVARIVGLGTEVPGGQIPFTPRTKRTFEFALREALAVGHNYIGPEHLLLGILREHEGVAVKILGDHGVTDEMLRDKVFEALHGKKIAEARVLWCELHAREYKLCNIDGLMRPSADRTCVPRTYRLVPAE